MSEIKTARGELVQNDNYGTAMTAKGLQLIAKIIATKANLTLVKVMMGSGTPPEDMDYIGDLEDLIQPVAAGTVSEPVYKDSTVEMTVEYRSDMNGGLQEGFVIQEFGIFAKDPDTDGDVMILYGNLSKYPQYIAPYTGGGNDIRRYPVSITIAEGTTVILEGLPSTVMTLDDIKDYCVTTLLPQLLTSSQNQIVAHNLAEDAHPNLRQKLEKAAEQVNQAAEKAKKDLEEAKQELEQSVSDMKNELKKELSDAMESAGGGSTTRITFKEGCAGWNYKITDGADETYTGIVPENLVVDVVLRKCSTVYTVTAWEDENEQDGWSNQVTTGQYFGSIESEVTDFLSTLTVTTVPNATVTAVCGNQSYTAQASEEGSAVLKIGTAGRYTVTAALNGEVSSATIEVLESGQSYSLTIKGNFHADLNSAKTKSFYTTFEPEDWEENELRIKQEVHGLSPVCAA